MSFSDLIANEKTEVQKIARELRNIINTVSGGIKEKFFGGNNDVAYYITENNEHVFAAIEPNDDHCRFYIHHTDEINHGRLPLMGKGADQVPYLKIFSIRDISRKKLEGILQEVVKVAQNKDN